MNTDRQDKIAAYAHSLWEAAGKPEGQDDRFWFEAEQALGEHSNSSEATVTQQSELKPSKPGKSAKPT